MSLKIKGNAILEEMFPATIDRQCTWLKNKCSSCGERFEPGVVTKCPKCGTLRKRCGNRCMTNEDSCRNHAKGRALSMYSKVAASLSTSSLEEFIEADDRDLSQEFALARAALGGLFDKEGPQTAKEALSNIKAFFEIALKKKQVEEGDTLNIKWDDDMAHALRKRFRQVINTLNLSIKKHVTSDVLKDGIDPEYIQKLIFKDVRDNIQVLGNQLTAPIGNQDGKSTRPTTKRRG